MYAYRTKSGFTLLEIILIVAILGIILVLGMSMTAKQGENFKIKAAAIQTQQIMRAGFLFYAKNNRFPDSTKNQDVQDFKPYLPVLRGNVNPWGHAYSYKGKDKNFSITFLTPSNEIAKKVIGLLPPGTSINDNQVTSSQTLPMQNVSSYSILYVGTTDVIDAKNDSKLNNKDQLLIIPLYKYQDMCSGELKVTAFISGWDMYDNLWNAYAATILQPTFYIKTFFKDNQLYIHYRNYVYTGGAVGNGYSFFKFIVSYIVGCEKNT